MLGGLDFLRIHQLYALYLKLPYFMSLPAPAIDMHASVSTGHVVGRLPMWNLRNCVKYYCSCPDVLHLKTGCHAVCAVLVTKDNLVDHQPHCLQAREQGWVKVEVQV